MKNIAILAVHGVGHHVPKASATAIADLLLRVPRDGESHYSSFRELDLQVPTRPLEARAERPGRHARWTGLNERPARPSKDGGEAPDHLLMSEQLRGYKRDEMDGIYSSVRFEGHHITREKRTKSAGASKTTTDANVDIYEFFWSDISQIGTSALAVFGAFYQIIIHLPYIGRSTIDFARVAEKDRRRGWSAIAIGHTWAMRALTLVIPTLNMVMMALGLSLLVRHVPDSAVATTASVLLGLVVAVGVTLLMYRARIAGFGIATLIPIGLGILASVSIPTTTQPATWLLFEVWALAAGGLCAVLVVFNRNRPGALLLGVILIALTTVGLIVYTPGAGRSLSHIVLPVLEWHYFILSLSWIIFGAGFTLVVLGGLIVSATRPRRPPESAGPKTTAAIGIGDPGSRAAYTARFTLALPAVAFSVATLLVWGLLVTAESKTAFTFEPTYVPVLRHPALLSHVRADVERNKVNPGDITTACAIDSRKSAESVRCAPAYFIRTFAGVLDTQFGVVATALTLLALLLPILFLGPIVWTELQSPNTPPDRDERDAADSRSMRMGTWLNFSFGAGRVAGELLGLACIVAFIGLVVVAPHPWWLANRLGLDSFVPQAGSGIGFLNYGGLLLGGASTLSILAVVHWLSGAGAGLRPVLGIAADVDNYLRELPVDRTPRARLVERYASLLRYICDRRLDPVDPDSSYDALVIVAHSQGTVITADLLRYLQVERKERGQDWEPRLNRLFDTAGADRLPIYLFTMGSPLRQLYAQRFPHLYGWTSDESHGKRGPVASQLGIKRWVNVYRSGDYVGRRLWGTELTDAAGFFPSEFPGVGHAEAEACIGPGAHTHYWDETADYVGLGLDGLVDELLAPSRG